MIKQAIERKSDIYDFRGVSGVVDENHPQYGLYRFKKGFGAEFTEFIGEIYIPYKPIVYKMYKFAEKTFRTLRTMKKKILGKWCMKKLQISRKDLKANISIIVKKANLYGKSDEGKRVKVIGVVKANGMGLRFSRIF